MKPQAWCILIFLFSLGSPLPAKAQPSALTTTAASETPMPSFGSLFMKLPSDFRRLPTVTNGIVVGSATGLALAVHPRDRATLDEMRELLTLEEVLDAGEPLGSGIVQAGGGLATYMVGRFSHQPEIAIVGADLVRAQVVAGALTQGIKAAARRDRPDGGGNSFPSGHSAASFATASVLQRHFGWKASVPAYALATYVASSRLSENQHFLSDVVFGAGLGIISGRAVTVGRRTHSFALSPTVGRGSAGINFTMIPSRAPAER